MQVNKYEVEVKIDGRLLFTIAAQSSEEAASLASGHLQKLSERQWEAPHAAPGILQIAEEMNLIEPQDPRLVASENP